MSEDQSEPRILTPFKIINRGEDTLGANHEVVFADFSPRVLPANAVEEDEIVVTPKDVSAPERVPYSELTQTTERQMSEMSVLPPVGEEDGKPNLTESGTQSSSFSQKNGNDEQLA